MWMSKLYAHKTMKQPNLEDLEYYIYKYSNYCRPRKNKFQTENCMSWRNIKHTVVVMNITINNSFISFWIEKSTSLLILALYLLKEIANIGKKKLYMYLHEVPDTLYVSQVNILKLSWTKCPSKYNSVILSEHRHELF